MNNPTLYYNGNSWKKCTDELNTKEGVEKHIAKNGFIGSKYLIWDEGRQAYMEYESVEPTNIPKPRGILELR